MAPIFPADIFYPSGTILSLSSSYPCGTSINDYEYVPAYFTACLYVLCWELRDDISHSCVAYTYCTYDCTKQSYDDADSEM